MANDIIYRLAGEEDIDNINELYNTVYKKHRTAEQFNWEFNSAPGGETIYVIALHEGKVVGTQCAIPIHVITKDNRRVLTAKLEDVLVSPQHRGKNIFGNMYRFSLEECRRRNMEFVWGFAYIVKEYKKIGFDIPYRNTMGLMAMDPKAAARYFYSIAAKRNTITYMKILGLCTFSYFKYLRFGMRRTGGMDIQTKEVELNSGTFNYLKYENLFGLELNTDFLSYRIYRNPYSKNYRTASWYEGTILKASIHYNITKQNIGFIIHTWFDKSVTTKQYAGFLKKVIGSGDLKDCSALRFWGFSHNRQNREEVDRLSHCGFTFLDRGISLVWLKLDENSTINPEGFVLSRMASQGTD